MNGGTRGKGEEWKMFSYAQEKETRYYLFEKGKTTGPYSLSQLKAMVETGSVRKTTPCKTGDEMEWHDLGYLLKSKKMAPSKNSISGYGEAKQQMASPINIAPMYGEPDDSFLSDFVKSGNPEPPGIDSGKPPGKVDDSMQHLIAGLIEVNANQNSLLQGIKRGLWALIFLIVFGSAAAALFLLD